MADILSQSAPKTTAEYKAAICQMMGAMERLNQKIREDQTDIDRTQAETAI